MIMVLECVYAMQDSIDQETIACREHLVELIVSEKLMDLANAYQDLPTSMEFALNVHREHSGALLQIDVFLFVDKTQLTLLLLTPVYASVVLVLWVAFARFAQLTTSSAMATVLLAPSTLTITLRLEIATAIMGSLLISLESVPKNAILTKFMT